MRLLATLLLAILLSPASARAQEEVPPEAEPTVTPAVEPDDETGDESDGEAIQDNGRREMFESVVQRIESLEAAIPALERVRELHTDPISAAEVSDKLVELRDDLRRNRADLNRLVSRLDPRYADEPTDTAIRWEDEAQELLSPVLSGIKQATVRPRRIEQLRSRIVNDENRIVQIDQAVLNATEAMNVARTEAARAEIGSVRAFWLEEQRELQEQLKLASFDLNQAQKERGGFGDASRAFFQLFFRSRGRNGLMALAIFLSVFLLLKILHRLLLGAMRVSEARRNTMGMRLLELGVYIVGTGGAIASALVVLYVSGDWVLLTIAAVLIVGLLWGARSGLPRFWREVQLLLNVGPVRQGERLVWEGVPWRVRSLHIITILENPALPDTFVRLPLAVLTELTSRPAGADEPWFPTEVGDFLIWQDRAARVLNQGPEFVVLELDRSRLTLPTGEFLAAGAANLSRGFRHRVSVTLDYRHQKIVTTTVPGRLKEHVASALAADPYGKHLLSLNCDFDAASASSLDLEIEADFDGAAADRWEPLTEIIQAAAVDACNAEGWEIALPQLTLHQAPAPAQPGPRLARGAEARA